MGISMDIQEIAEEIIWDEVSDYIEEIEEFKKMVEGIGYIDHDKVDEVEWCEVFEFEEINVVDYSDSEDEICVEFEMPFILSCWKENEQLFRVTACAKGKAVLEDEEIVELCGVTYDDVEVDSVYV